MGLGCSMFVETFSPCADRALGARGTATAALSVDGLRLFCTTAIVCISLGTATRSLPALQRPGEPPTPSGRAAETPSRLPRKFSGSSGYRSDVEALHRSRSCKVRLALAHGVWACYRWRFALRQPARSCSRRVRLLCSKCPGCGDGEEETKAAERQESVVMLNASGTWRQEGRRVIEKEVL